MIMIFSARNIHARTHQEDHCESLEQGSKSETSRKTQSQQVACNATSQPAATALAPSKMPVADSLEQ